MKPLKRRPLKSLQRNGVEKDGVEKDDANAFPWGMGTANPASQTGGTQRPVPQLPRAILGR